MNVWNNFSLHIDTFSLQTFAFFCVIIFSSLPKKGDRVETVSFHLCYYFYSKEYHGTDPNSYAFIFMSVTWIWLVGPLIRIVVPYLCIRHRDTDTMTKFRRSPPQHHFLVLLICISCSYWFVFSSSPNRLLVPVVWSFSMHF